MLLKSSILIFKLLAFLKVLILFHLNCFCLNSFHSYYLWNTFAVLDVCFWKTIFLFEYCLTSFHSLLQKIQQIHWILRFPVYVPTSYLSSKLVLLSLTTSFSCINLFQLVHHSFLILHPSSTKRMVFFSNCI